MTINVLYTINGKYKNLMLASCISMLINNSDKAFNIHIRTLHGNSISWKFLILESMEYLIGEKVK